MTMLLIFLPIIIIVFFLIVFVSFRNNFTLFGWINGKRAYLILNVYIVLLLIAAGIYLFGPKPDTAERSVVNNSARLSESIFDVTQGEQSDDILRDYIKSQESIPFEAQELKVEFTSHNYLSSLIVIDQTNDRQDVELTFYETPTYGNGIDVNDYLDHLSYKFEDDTITIEDSYKEREVTIITLTSAFTFDQFMKKEASSNEMIDRDQDDIQINPDVLYIRAPKDLIIDLGPYEDEIYRIQ